MANKNSFSIYKSWKTQVDMLTDEQAGIILKAVLAYQNGEELPEMDNLLKIVFSFLKNQFEEDEEEYADTCEKGKEISEKRSEAGKMGGRPKKQIEEKANGFSEKQMLFDEKQKKAKKANANFAFYEKENENKEEEEEKGKQKEVVEENKEREKAVVVSARTCVTPTETATATTATTETDFTILGEYRNIKVPTSFWEMFKKRNSDFVGIVQRLSDFKYKSGITSSKQDEIYLVKFAKEDAGKFVGRSSKSSFDTDEFFEAALRRSYGDLYNGVKNGS